MWTMCSGAPLDRLDIRSRLRLAEAPHVRIHRQLAFGCDAEHVDHLQPRRSRRVLNSHPDAQRAGIDLLAQPLLDLRNLLCTRRLVRSRSALGQDLGNTGAGIARPGIQRRSEHQRSRRHMTRRRAVVDDRPAFLHFQECRYIGHANLHLQRRRNAVKGLHPLAFDLLPVLVQIDKPRRHHQSGGLYHAPALQRLIGNTRDPAVTNADVAHGVKAGLGIHHPSAFEH